MWVDHKPVDMEINSFMSIYIQEGREGVKWQLGFAFFRGWEMGFCALGFCALGLGFMKQKQ